MPATTPIKSAPLARGTSIMVSTANILRRGAGAACALMAFACVLLAVPATGGAAPPNSPPARGACAPSWVPTFGGAPGMNNSVTSLVTFHDGSGTTKLYAGGIFSTAGGVAAQGVAMWNGSAWSPLGSGMNGMVESLAIFDDGAGGGPALYAGGSFTIAGDVAANYVARWNGTAWQPLGSGMNWEVRALAAFDDGRGGGPALYAAGAFDTAGGVTAHSIARWNGTGWSSLGGGANNGMNNAINALAVVGNGAGGGSSLYATGHFTTAGGVAANRVARWNGLTWSPLSSGLNGNGHALAAVDDGSGPALYAGGLFTTAGGTAANRVARWNGTSWSALGAGMADGGVYSLSSVIGPGGGHLLCAGGDFTVAGGGSANRIATWNGNAWTALGAGVDNAVLAVVAFDGSLSDEPAIVAGGHFVSAGGGTARHIAAWSGAAWSALGRGLESPVGALTVFDDGQGGGPAVYAAVTTATTQGPANNVARWDGSSWAPLGGGLNDAVYCLTTFDDGSGAGPALYAAGEFTLAGGVAAKRIAKWNGTTWSPLGSGLNGAVFALEAVNSGEPGGPALYAGGGFLTAGGAPANRVAKWDGHTWTTLGGGMSNYVFALAMFDDGSGPALFAGGNFETPQAGPGSYIAKWNGTAWTAIAAGGVGLLNNGVLTLTAHDDGSEAGIALYAGGHFTTAGGAPASHVARWNGSAWAPLGTGTNMEVRGFATFDDGTSDGPSLHAAGSFTVAGGIEAKHIASWNGSAWSAVGAGTDDVVRALAVFDDGEGSPPSLCAGGDFIVSPAGDSYLARWQRCPLAVPSDLDDDGIVGAADLAILLGGWGQGGITDINGDGTTDFIDLAVLLGAWTG